MLVLEFYHNPKKNICRFMEPQVRKAASLMGASFSSRLVEIGNTPRVVLREGKDVVFQREGYAGTKTLVDLYNRRK